jgi:hypothetical protein
VKYLSIVEEARKGRIILLNALPLNAFPIELDRQFEIAGEVATLDELVIVLKFAELYNIKIENYIRHEPTVRLLSQLTGVELKPENKLYSYSDSDEIYIITLKKPARGQEVEVKPEDLLIVRVKYSKALGEQNE